MRRSVRHETLPVLLFRIPIMGMVTPGHRTIICRYCAPLSKSHEPVTSRQTVSTLTWYVKARQVEVALV